MEYFTFFQNPFRLRVCDAWCNLPVAECHAFSLENGSTIPGSSFSSYAAAIGLGPGFLTQSFNPHCWHHLSADISTVALAISEKEQEGEDFRG